MHAIPEDYLIVMIGKVAVIATPKVREVGVLERKLDTANRPFICFGQIFTDPYKNSLVANGNFSIPVADSGDFDINATEANRVVL